MVNDCFLFIVFLFLIPSCGTSVKSATNQNTRTSNQILTRDLLDNTYVVDRNGLIIKYSSSDSLFASYQNKYYGVPTNLDVFNPQKILVYYGRYNKLLILDQTLTSEREVDLEKDLGWQVGCVAQASDQNLWVYNFQDRALKKITLNGAELVTSDPLNFMSNTKFTPERIVEKNDQVYVSDPKVGWLRFDLFGQFVDIIEQPHDWFYLTTRDELIYLRNDELWRWIPGSSVPERFIKEPNWIKKFLKQS